MIHPSFDHGGAVLEAQAQKRLRHAHVVVEVAFGGEHSVVAPARAQNRGDHLRRRGFAVAAAHGNEAERVAGAPALGGKPESGAHVRDDNLCNGRLDGPRHNGGAGAGGRCFFDEIVPVEALARKGGKDNARGKFSRICFNAGEAFFAVARRQGRRRRERRKRAFEPGEVFKIFRLACLHDVCS